MSSFRLLVSLFSFFIAVVPTLVPLGTTIELGGVDYYVPGKPFTSIDVTLYGQLPSDASSAPWLPVTVVKAPSAAANAADVQAVVDIFGGADDVWTTEFLSGILVTEANVTAAADANSTCILSLSGTASVDIPQGPYLLTASGELYQPWRLYPDFAGAFVQATVPSLSDPAVYTALPATVAGYPGVAVPSRLYYTKTAEKPLAGVRTGLKDIFDLAGVQTSNGNRAYYGLYPPRTASALVVQRLTDAGAVIVGKMKTSQFANGEVATADWVDYHSPFNPRGDGYQDPSSSSSGPGSGIASFPWLDLTLGSDTGGSIRGPSQAQGVFGNRPTHDLVALTGVMPLAPQLDTAGFLVRDPSIWKAAAQAAYATNLTFYPSYPSKIKTIAFPTNATVPADNLTAQVNTVLLGFLSKLESFVNTKATALNYTAQWDNAKPDPSLPPLSILLNRTYATIVTKEQTRLLRAPFYKDYAAKHDGRLPAVNPVPLVRWAYGDSIPDSDLDQAIANKTIFKNWFEANVLPPANASSATCSDSFLLYSVAPTPTYRSTYLQPPKPPFSFNQKGQIPVFAETPDFIIPIGSAKYYSNVTQHIEELPVTVDIIVGRGCDGVVYRLVEDLVKAGILDIPMTGQTEKGGEVLLKKRSGV